MGENCVRERTVRFEVVAVSVEEVCLYAVQFSITSSFAARVDA